MVGLLIDERNKVEGSIYSFITELIILALAQRD
jgi:hypothetical protein